MKSSDCEKAVNHKPCAWTEPDANGELIGVCACGRFVWKRKARTLDTVTNTTAERRAERIVARNQNVISALLYSTIAL